LLILKRGKASRSRLPVPNIPALYLFLQGIIERPLLDLYITIRRLPITIFAGPGPPV
jgi:hypothetical protein